MTPDQMFEAVAALMVPVLIGFMALFTGNLSRGLARVVMISMGLIIALMAFIVWKGLTVT